MNYTEKYRLPQWEEEDRILRTDFNQAMARIEDAIYDAPYRVGQYYGTGRAQTVVVGFQPLMLFITEVHDGKDFADAACGTFSMYGRSAADDPQVSMIQNGFYMNSKHQYPSVNQKDKRYYYIAFR